MRWLVLPALALSACGGADRGDATSADSSAWYSAWGTANYTTFPNGPLTQPGFSPNTGLFVDNQADNQSFRMMIHPTAGGERARLRFSNVYGDRALRLENVSLAQRLLPTGPSIEPASLIPVSFDGATAVSIPAGEERLSDPVAFQWAYGDDLAVNFHVPEPSGPISWHAEAFATQYLSLPGSGDVSTDASGLSLGNISRGWFFLSGLQAQQAAATPWTIVTFGDSITDGFFGTPELNHRYPDFLAGRLQAAVADSSINVGVVNAGINSNQVLGGGVLEGAAGVERFERDVLQRASVGAVFILLGTNDLSSGTDAQTVYAGLVDIAQQAHAADVCTLVSTILPRNDPPVPFGWDAATEEPQRLALNQLILSSDAFDAVVDLAGAMENPLLPGQPLQAYFLEGLHPNSIGMQVLADAIPLAPLLPPPLGQCSR